MCSGSYSDPQAYFAIFMGKLSCRTTKIATSNDRKGITSKKPGTVLSMQNVDVVLMDYMALGVIGNRLVKGKG